MGTNLLIFSFIVTMLIGVRGIIKVFKMQSKKSNEAVLKGWDTKIVNTLSEQAFNEEMQREMDAINAGIGEHFLRMYLKHQMDKRDKALDRITQAHINTRYALLSFLGAGLLAVAISIITRADSNPSGLVSFIDGSAYEVLWLALGGLGLGQISFINQKNQIMEEYANSLMDKIIEDDIIPTANQLSEIIEQRTRKQGANSY